VRFAADRDENLTPKGGSMSVRGRFGATLAALALGVAGLSVAAPPATAAAAAQSKSAGAEVTTVKVGPFVLAPAPVGTVPNQNRVLPEIDKPCSDCFITSVVPHLVYADGSAADMDTGVMLHHLVIVEPGRTDVTCGRTEGIGAAGRRIFASGNERTPITLPDGYGFKVDQERWAGIIELMNHSDQPKTVYFTADVTHVPANTPGMKPVTPVWLDVNNCSDSQYSVPAGKSATPWTWMSTITGRVVAAGGHVHAGGQGLTLDNATTKQRICSSSATYGMDTAGMDGMKGMDSPAMKAMDGMVTKMSTCSWDSLGVLHRGDDLRLTSLYDAPHALRGVMGIMLIAVYETNDLTGGTRAPASMRRTPDTKVPADIADDEGGH
jgi:hypothetical protein